MKRLLLLSLLLMPTLALAQQPTPIAPEAPITLSITISKADKIWRGLRKLPVEEVEELMNEIRQQVASQTQSKPTEVKPNKPEPEK